MSADVHARYSQERFPCNLCDFQAVKCFQFGRLYDLRYRSMYPGLRIEAEARCLDLASHVKKSPSCTFELAPKLKSSEVCYC